MVFRVFYANTYKDVSAHAISKFSVGSGSGDTVSVPDSHLKKGHVTVTLDDNSGWQLKSKDDVFVGGAKVSQAPIVLGVAIGVSEEDDISIFAISDPPERSTTINVSSCAEISIGSADDNGIVLKSRFISKRHLIIEKNGDKYCLSDRKSTNGTYVNGVRTSGCVLGIGDEIVLGDARIVFSGRSLEIHYASDLIRANGISTPGRDYSLPVTFKRSPRLKANCPPKTIEVESPPAMGGKPEISWLSTLLPALSTMGIAVVMATFMGNAMMLLYSLPMTGIGLILSIINYSKQKKKYTAQIDLRLEKYSEHLDGVIGEIERYQQEQLHALESSDPDLQTCFAIASNLDRRLWQRRATDDDFLSVRLGHGQVPSAVDIHYSKKALSLEEDELAARPQQIYEKYHLVDGAPIICSATLNSTIGLVGTANETMTLLCNIIVQMATHHIYSETKFVLLCNQEQLRQLEWIKKIPHFMDDERTSVYIALNKHEASSLCDAFEKELKDRKKDRESDERGETSLRLPFLVFFAADPSLLEGETIRRYLLNEGKNLGTCTVLLYDQLQSLPKECGTIIELKGKTGEIYSKERASERSEFALDAMSDNQYREFAEALGNIICDENSAEAGITSSISLFEVLGIQSLDQLDLQKNWSLSNVTKSLAAPLGVKEKNELVYLDLHESAHGPHGLVAGTTGSGKSEVMQSYVLAMAANFHPYEVGFVIIDFKGGGMVNQFKDLPHLIGAITDMDGKEVNRSLLSIKAELDKRKRLFAEHNVNKIDQYIELFKCGKTATPLPHLIIIVDEFAELKADQPEFMQELISAARIGRSLGVHLILATQKPAGQVNEQIWSNSKFKLCLKVQDASDSREVLKSPLAAKIKEPGRAYLKVGNDEAFELLQSGYSGVKTQYNGQTVTELTGMVQHIKAYCEGNGIQRLMPICLPPLPQLLPYPDELPLIEALVPVGKYDAPSAQEQEAVMVNIAENTFVVGSAQMGKTNLLQSMIRTLAWNLSPSEINIYIMDFGAMTLKSFEALNHVGGVVLPDEDEKLKNLFKLLEREIEQRKKKMIASGVSSFQAYLEGGFTDIPRIVLLLDGFVTFSELYGDDYGGALQHVCRDGLACGITVVVTNTQTTGFGYKYLSLFKDRIAFTCNDSSEYSSIFDRCRMEPSNFKGRCLCAVGEEVLEAQIFLAFEGKKEIERTTAMKAFVEMVNARHPRERAVTIPAIPEMLDLTYIQEHYDAPAEKYACILGLDYGEVDVVSYDLGALCELGIAGSAAAKNRAVAQIILASLQVGQVQAPTSVYIVDSIERPLQMFKDAAMTKTYTIDFGEAGTIIDEMYEIMQQRYDTLVRGSVDELEKLPLIMAVFQNQSVPEFISANRDVLEKYKKIVKQAQSLKILFLFSNLEGASVPFSGPELLKSLKNLKNLVVTDDLREFQFVEFPPVVVRTSKPLQKSDTYCVVNGEVKRMRLCGGEGR